jgi:hypothetical protein
MPNNDFTISFAQLVWLVGGFTALGAFLKWAMTPFKKIEEHENRISALEKSESENKAFIQYTTKALDAIVNHMIDGNVIEKLQEVRDEYHKDIFNHL